MTVAHHEPGGVALPTVTSSTYPALQGLDDWLRAAGSASQLARQLVHSFFVPQAYKPGNPRDEAAVEQAVANATGAILLGQSLGIDPLTALQQIYVVHGRPGMYAKMKVALAQARGHRVWDEQYSAEAVTVAGQRAGSDDVVRITITIEDARRAGWTSNDAYRKTPADMLWARAASRVVDRVAADVLFGLSSIEDLADEPEPPRVTAQVSAADVLKARPAPALTAEAAPEPAPAPSDEPADPASSAGPRITEQQWRAINARFVDLGITGAGKGDARLWVIGCVVGMPIDKGSDLSASDAQLVLDNLTADVVREHLAETQWADLLPPEQPAEQPDPVADAQSHAAAVEQQIADARAAADERAARAAADEAQAESVDPTIGTEWPA